MVQEFRKSSLDDQLSCKSLEIEIIVEGSVEIEPNFLKDVIDYMLMRMGLAPCDDPDEGRHSHRIINRILADTRDIN